MKKPSFLVLRPTRGGAELLLLGGALLFAIGSGVLIGFDFRASLWLLGLIGMGGYVWLSFRYPFTAFLILIFAAATEALSRVQITGSISLMVGLGGLFVASWVGRLSLHQAVFTRSKDYLVLSVFALWIIVSVLANSQTLRFRNILTYFQQLLLIVLILNFATSIVRLKMLGSVIIASACFSAIFMLVDQGGWLPIAVTRHFTAYLALGRSETYTRSTGFFSDPNYTAAYLIAVLPFVFERGLNARRWRTRLSYLAIVGVILWAFSTTVSLGGAIGLLVVLLLQILRMKHPGLILAALALPCFILVNSSTTGISNDIFIKRLSLNIELLFNTLEIRDFQQFLQLASGRGEAWMAAWKAFNLSPFWGYGPGNGIYENARFLISQQKDFAWAHNTFLTIAVDLGGVGLFLFIILLICAVLAVGSLNKKHYVIENFAGERHAVFAAILAILVMGLALDVFVLKLPWILIGMALAYKNITPDVVNIHGNIALKNNVF